MDTVTKKTPTTNKKSYAYNQYQKMLVPHYSCSANKCLDVKILPKILEDVVEVGGDVGVVTRYEKHGDKTIYYDTCGRVLNYKSVEK